LSHIPLKKLYLIASHIVNWSLQGRELSGYHHPWAWFLFERIVHRGNGKFGSQKTAGQVPFTT